jgi:alginate O-acetyltransferase complex protein AlgJ
MKSHVSFYSGLVLLASCLYCFSAPYETLNKTFNRTKSHVVVRKIIHPTLANLDCAAYFANPVRYDPQPVRPKGPAKKISFDQLTFSGAISSPCVSLSQTPLTEPEKEQPLAWDPLQNRLWEITKTDLFGKITAAVNGEKWADPSVFLPYQEIVAAYLHGEGDTSSLWVKIEFKPWVTFLNNLPDESKDGFKEIFGKADLSAIDKKFLNKAFEWIRSDYCEKILTKDQTIDWANTLASYWYPKLNTDIVDMTGQPAWPTSDTEKKIKRELKGFTAVNPLVVIRGNPYGEKIYNVYVVDFPQVGKSADTLVPAAALPTPAAVFPQIHDSGVSGNFRDNNARFEQETRTFGNYPVWAKKEEMFRRSIASVVNSLPQAQMGFAGKDGWLFFRKEIDYLNGGDLCAQDSEYNPLPRLIEFKNFLEKNNISLLFCVVPNKSDVYFEELPADAPKEPAAIINPFGRKFLADLQRSGIEVVDLLPEYLSAKQDDPKYAERLYQKHDTHWTLRGLQIAAQRIADRIKHYSWYEEITKNAVHFTEKDTTCSRLGDIVERLPEKERSAYPADILAAQQICNPDGSLYKASKPDAPILLIGDSFTGVFELVDCKSAGVGAHIAAATGIPVDIITSWGGGPLVRDKMLRARSNYLPKKRLVIYLMVARDLYNYSQTWLPLEIK